MYFEMSLAEPDLFANFFKVTTLFSRGHPRVHMKVILDFEKVQSGHLISSSSR